MHIASQMKRSALFLLTYTTIWMPLSLLSKSAAHFVISGALSNNAQTKEPSRAGRGSTTNLLDVASSEPNDSTTLQEQLQSIVLDDFRHTSDRLKRAIGYEASDRALQNIDKRSVSSNGIFSEEFEERKFIFARAPQSDHDSDERAHDDTRNPEQAKSGRKRGRPKKDDLVHAGVPQTGTSNVHHEMATSEGRRGQEDRNARAREEEPSASKRPDITMDDASSRIEQMNIEINQYVALGPPYDSEDYLRWTRWQKQCSNVRVAIRNGNQLSARRKWGYMIRDYDALLQFRLVSLTSPPLADTLLTY